MLSDTGDTEALSVLCVLKLLRCDGGGKRPRFDVKSLESRNAGVSGDGRAVDRSLSLHANFHLKVIIYSLLTHATANYVQAGATNVTTG